jgi:hypothetical protein
VPTPQEAKRFDRTVTEGSSSVPAKSEKQRKFFAAEHERVAEGKSPAKTKGMSQKQRHDFMKKGKGK